MPHEESYSPLHVHAQTFVTDAQQELSDAECDRDLRHMTENGNTCNTKTIWELTSKVKLDWRKLLQKYMILLRK